MILIFITKTGFSNFLGLNNFFLFLDKKYM